MGFFDLFKRAFAIAFGLVLGVMAVPLFIGLILAALGAF